MPRRTKIDAGNSRLDEVKSALKRVGKDPDNCFRSSTDATLYKDRREDFATFYVWGDRWRDVGLVKGDMVVIDTSKKETPEGEGIICSVVTNDRDFDDWLDFAPEEFFGFQDVLDVEYIYPSEAEGPKRRAKKTDSPQIKRIVIGVVTHVIRETELLRPALGD